MDPFDEFEFKPLTNGLGFHKKAAALKDQLKKSGVVDTEIQGIPKSMPKTFDDVITNLEKSPLKLNKQPIHDLEITETLPRDGKKGVKAMEVETPRPVQSPFPKPEAFRQPFVPATPTTNPTVNEAKKVLKQKEMQNIGTRRGAADSPKSVLEVTSTSIPSAILDLVIVVALSLIFVIALTMVTGVDLSVVIMNMGQDLMTQLSAAMLLVSVMQMYVIISRSFYGCTFGEWTFDVQLGSQNDQVESVYPLRVALRSLIVTATGLIVLPLISLVTGRDIAGKISGTQLYRQRL